MDAPPQPGQDGGHGAAPAITEPLTPTADPDTAPPLWPTEEVAAAGSLDGAGGSAASGPRRLTRRRAALAALLAAGGAVAAIVLASGHHGKAGTSTTGVPAGETTAAVTRRTLTESSTVDGTLGYGTTLELYDRLGGTFTWLPSVGETIFRGGTLFRVNNLPVVLMYGAVPAYRALKEGVADGPDVAELNRNLILLGYDPSGAITDLEAFGAATAAATRRWQKAEGLTETGQVELGRVVFAPSARRVTEVHVALGQDPPGPTGSSAPPSAGESTTPSTTESPAKGNTPRPDAETGKGTGNQGKPNDAGKPKSKEPAAKEGKAKEPGGSKHPSSSSDPPSHGSNNEGSGKEGSGKEGSGKEGSGKEGSGKEGSGKEGSGKEGSGNQEGAGEVVLTTTSTQQLVQLKLKAEQQQLAHVGEQAPVTLPGGEVVQGRIIEVGTVASEVKGENEHGGSSNEGSGESTIPVTLALTHRVARLDQAPVSVELVKSVRRNVLAVPATALTATGGGGYAITVLEGDRRVQLSVTPGMFANGYVQVEGAGLHPGQTVVESE
jgi:hypothetical protein